MHIDNGQVILNMGKSAQELQNVKTPEDLTDRELTRALRDAIVGELGAIKQYEVIVDGSTNEDVKEVLQKIANEEKVHIGELQKLLSELLSDEDGFLEDGAKEVSKDVGDVEVEGAEDAEGTEETEETEE